MYFSIYTLQVVCVTRFDQSECVMCRVIFALANMSRFQRCICALYMVKFLALFQACVGNFYTIQPWKVVGTLNLDSSYVTFTYFAFLSICC